MVGSDGADVLGLHKTSVGAAPVDVSLVKTESLGATVDGQTLDDFVSAPTESKLHGAVSTNLAPTDSGAVNLDLTTPSNNSSGENKMPTMQQAEAQHDDADIAMLPPAWVLPDIELLEHANVKTESACYSQEELRQLSRMVESKLSDFGVKAQVVNVLPGPVITRFELDLSPGTKVSRITGLAKDLARSMSVLSVRVVEVIPGKSVIGLELPNRTREVVRLRELLTSAQFSDTQCRLALALGKSISGEPVVVDLAKMPHLLVAGTTGSGKSVCVNALLLSLLYKYTPSGEYLASRAKGVSEGVCLVGGDGAGDEVDNEIDNEVDDETDDKMDDRAMFWCCVFFCGAGLAFAVSHLVNLFLNYKIFQYSLKYHAGKLSINYR